MVHAQAQPSQLVQRPQYSLQLFPDWSCETRDRHLFRGSSIADWLVIDFASTAAADQDMHHWDVIFPMSPCGFPSAQVASALIPRPALVVSGSDPISEEYRLRLRADEVRGFVGFADYGSAGGRIYLLLARRQNLAWKVFLSIARESDLDKELAALRDDHRRAALIFGSLTLLDPTASPED
jgi:hypothetical protein